MLTSSIPLSSVKSDKPLDAKPLDGRRHAALRALGRVVEERGPEFARELDTARAAGRKLDAQDPRAARHAAEQLLSQLFFGPMLAEMRKLPFGGEIGGGGRMEEVFGQQLDTRIADQVAAGDHGGITTRWVSWIQSRGAEKPLAELAARRTAWTQRLGAFGDLRQPE